MNRRVVENGIKLGRKTNVNDGIITAVYHMRQNNVPIKRIAKDLQIGVGTVYKILDKVAWQKVFYFESRTENPCVGGWSHLWAPFLPHSI